MKKYSSTRYNIKNLKMRQISSSVSFFSVVFVKHPYIYRLLYGCLPLVLYYLITKIVLFCLLKGYYFYSIVWCCSKTTIDMCTVIYLLNFVENSSPHLIDPIYVYKIKIQLEREKCKRAVQVLTPPTCWHDVYILF